MFSVTRRSVTMDARMMRRFGFAVAVLVIVGFASCSAEVIANSKRDLVTMDCTDCGSSEEVSLRGRVLNAFLPRNQFGQPAFTAGPLTFGVEAAVMDGLRGWMAVMAAAPLAIFMLWG